MHTDSLPLECWLSRPYNACMDKIIPPIKIVVVGAGSASFGLNTLAALMRSRRLRGSHLALVDRNQKALDLVERLAAKLNDDWQTGLQVSAYKHHQDALKGADFVVLAIEAPPREALWRKDFEIPLKYGVRQPYAENGGPGGFAHAARNIGPVMQIVRAMETICPEAWLINFTNPMTRICDAVHRYSRIKVVGLCHQILVGYALVGIALADDLQIDIPVGITGSHAHPVESPLRRQVSRQAFEKLDIQAAGINHFTWMLRLTDRRTGEDLYPLFTQRWRELPRKFEPLTHDLFDAFGIFPISGDEHLCEYLPWLSDPITQPWERFDLSLYDWDIWAQLRMEGYSEIERMTSGDKEINGLLDADSEGALEFIENIAFGGDYTHLAYNFPNRGQIANLPEGAIVETPGRIISQSLQPVETGPLPYPVAELCRRELAVVHLAVDASVQGDRKKALQCLLLDPVIRDMEIARQVLDDYLIAYREYLPQFWVE